MANTVSDDKWLKRYLRLAREVSSWSKDPSTKVGAVAVTADGVVLSLGYNGFPRGVEDTLERMDDRKFKLDHVVHAEENCILNAARNGVSLKESILYVYGLPICHRCATSVIQSGVRRVVFAADPPKDLRDEWRVSFEKSLEMFKEVYVGTKWFYKEDIDI